MKNNKTILLFLMLFALIFSSCSKDEEFEPEIDANGMVTLVSNSGTEATVSYSGDLINESTYSINFAIRKKGETEYINSVYTNINSYTFEGLGPSETYEVTVLVDGLKESPYNTVEFTTAPFQYVLKSNMEEDVFLKTELGYNAEFEVDGISGSDLGNTQLFLVDLENEDYKVKLNVTKEGNILKFEVPQEALPTLRSYRKVYALHYGTNANKLTPLEYKYNNDYKRSIRIDVYRPETYIGHFFSQDIYTNTNCGFNKAFRISFEGSFYWLREGPQSVLLTNLDNGTELIMLSTEVDTCNTFSQGIIEKQNSWKGLYHSALHINFLESIDQGLVPGNYSVKIMYNLDDGFHESNTFEFEITE